MSEISDLWRGHVYGTHGFRGFGVRCLGPVALMLGGTEHMAEKPAHHMAARKWRERQEGAGGPVPPSRTRSQ